MARIEVVVEADQAGERIDRFLASVVGSHSRSQIQRLIKDGLVTVNGQPTRANTSVHAADRIALEVPEPVAAAPSPEAIPLDVVYEDHDLIVVNKPAGMVVHPAAGHATGTLVNALLHRVTDLSGIGGELRPGIVHRLDRGTSGLIAIAKPDRAHEALARQFHDREVEKEYLALVWGVVQAGRRIDLPIGRDPSNRLKMSARARRARTAVTRITRVRQFRGVTLAQVAIATGRTHQIRVHLSAIHHPIVGDPLYGGVHKRVPADLRPVMQLTRPFLHAARIAFEHPIEGRRLELTAPLPDDLQHVLDAIVAAQDAPDPFDPEAE
jgi:23S rRNA pseudouridine1911/1915/1917 synthase